MYVRLKTRQSSDFPKCRYLASIQPAWCKLLPDTACPVCMCCHVVWCESDTASSVRVYCVVSVTPTLLCAGSFNPITGDSLNSTDKTAVSLRLPSSLLHPPSSLPPSSLLPPPSSLLPPSSLFALPSSLLHPPSLLPLPSVLLSASISFARHVMPIVSVDVSVYGVCSGSSSLKNVTRCRSRLIGINIKIVSDNMYVLIYFILIFIYYLKWFYDSAYGRVVVARPLSWRSRCLVCAVVHRVDPCSLGRDGSCWCAVCSHMCWPVWPDADVWTVTVP